MRCRLREYLQHFIWILSGYDLFVMMIYILAVSGSVVCEMFIPVVIGNVVKELVADYPETTFWHFSYSIIFCALCSILFSVVIHMLRVKMKEDPVFKIQKKSLHKLFCLGIPFTEKRNKEQSFLIFSAMIPMVSEIITKHIPELIRSLITIVITMIFFIKYSGNHYFLILFSMIPGLWIHRRFNKVIADRMTIQIERHKKFQSIVMATISAVKEMRMHRCGEWMQSKVMNHHKDYVDERLKTLKMRYLRGMFFRLNTALGITLYFLLAMYDYAMNRLEIDAFVSSLFFCTMLIFTFNGLFFHITETIPALEYVRSLRNFLGLSQENEKCLKWKEAEPLRQEISVHINCFSYGKERILNDIDVLIHKGEKAAIVGASGSGKTTLLKLIADMYQTQDGELLWDHVNYREMNPVSLRKRIGFLFQETYMFGESIYENIKIGNPEATDDQIYDAARQSCVDSFVKELPMGYETCVGERGTLLSGGQIQRIAIARLILKNPDVIIMDEITANLDSETEGLIMNRLFEVFHDKTIISVSHKAAILPYFHRFFYVNDSGIKEIDKDLAYEYV